MKYTVILRNNATGEERRYADGFEWDDEGHFTFMWTDGNYGCDCNRELFFKRAGGEQGKVDLDDERCGSERYAALRAEREDGTTIAIDSLPEANDVPQMTGSTGNASSGNDSAASPSSTSSP
jgi:hypothetical protein